MKYVYLCVSAMLCHVIDIQAAENRVYAGQEKQASHRYQAHNANEENKLLELLRAIKEQDETRCGELLSNLYDLGGNFHPFLLAAAQSDNEQIVKLIVRFTLIPPSDPLRHPLDMPYPGIDVLLDLDAAYQIAYTTVMKLINSASMRDIWAFFLRHASNKVRKYFEISQLYLVFDGPIGQRLEETLKAQELPSGTWGDKCHRDYLDKAQRLPLYPHESSNVVPEAGKK